MNETKLSIVQCKWGYLWQSEKEQVKITTLENSRAPEFSALQIFVFWLYIMMQFSSEFTSTYFVLPKLNSLWRIADAEENLGESEVREAHLAKSLHFIRVGEKVGLAMLLQFYLWPCSQKNVSCGWHIVEPLFQEKALEQLKVTEGKTVAVGQKMDLVFHTLQIGFFYMDFDLISKSIDKAKK